MKTRRHHNNTGYRQIKRGKTAIQVERMARRLGLPFKVKNPLEGEQDARVHTEMDRTGRPTK